MNELNKHVNERDVPRVTSCMFCWIFTLSSFFRLHVNDDFLVEGGGGNHERYHELGGGITSVK